MTVTRSKQTISEICQMFQRREMTDGDRDTLGQSLFYYCCGKDPTPVSAFSDTVPLYIYVDILDCGDFAAETADLFRRLKKLRFVLLESRTLPCVSKLMGAKNAILTQWKRPFGQTFFLLYVQSDAVTAFRDIYGEKQNYIQPKYICNYRNELSSGFFREIEKRVQYILGHCFDDKFRCIGEFDYLGDYESQPCRMKLYHRLFYYVY